jgi:hypothetical protein
VMGVCFTYSGPGPARMICYSYSHQLLNLLVGARPNEDPWRRGPGRLLRPGLMRGCRLTTRDTYITIVFGTPYVHPHSMAGIVVYKK